MVQIYQIAEASQVRQHAIFLHGLNGDYLKTWGATVKDSWLSWLSEVEGLSIWSISYPANISRWQHGNAMHVLDRSEGILQLLLAKKSLEEGEIALIGHSMGGLVIKQVLRLAYDRADNDARAQSFIHRVRKVAFLGTPHSGSGFASLMTKLPAWLRFSSAIQSLRKDDPSLRDLNKWYRDKVSLPRVAHLVLAENKGQGPRQLGGLIVSPSSADPGIMHTRAIDVDETHTSICKPPSRDSAIYHYVKDFLERDSKEDSSLNLPTESFLIKSALREPSKTPESKAEIQIEAPFVSSYLADEELKNQIRSISRGRSIPAFEAPAKALALSKSVLRGPLKDASRELKAEALTLCVRILSFTQHDYPELEQAFGTLESSEATQIAAIYLGLKEENWKPSVASLIRIGSKAARTAALGITQRFTDERNALEWLKICGFGFEDLDSTGKLIALSASLTVRAWDDTGALAELVSAEDIDETPVLGTVLATCLLASLVPHDFRDILLEGEPFDKKGFPISVVDENLPTLQRVVALHRQFAHQARQLGLQSQADFEDDTALWIELRDPTRHAAALAALKAGMSEIHFSVRNLPLAYWYHCAIDVSEAERRVALVEARNGGVATPSTTLAKLFIGMKKGGDGGFNFIRKNRSQIATMIDEAQLQALEFDLILASKDEELLKSYSGELSAAGTLSAAVAQRLENSNALPAHEELRVAVENLSDETPTTQLLKLVADLKAARHPHYPIAAKALFERTGSMDDAIRAARAYLEVNKHTEAISVCASLGEAAKSVQAIQEILGWAYLLLGDLQLAEMTLDALSGDGELLDLRQLRMQLSILSGAWSQLSNEVERTWKNRNNENPSNLLFAANLAVAMRSSKAFELCKQAAFSAPSSPEVLLQAYSLATRTGDEGRPEVGEWLRAAVDLSADDGPVRKMDLRALLDSQASWQKNRESTLELLRAARVPLFMAATSLGSSLFEVIVIGSIRNTLENDYRRKEIIPIFAGDQSTIPKEINKLAIDVSVLLTFGFLDRLDLLLGLSRSLLMAHSTLHWLFEVQQKISHHQPSQIARAHDLQEMVADGRVRVLDFNYLINVIDGAELGNELALKLYAARRADKSTFVLICTPVHRQGSILNENVDLIPYREHFRTCVELLNEIERKGVLTQAELTRVRTHLTAMEQPLVPSQGIPEGSELLIDEVALATLLHLNILEKIRAAGFRIAISSASRDQAAALVSMERHTQAGHEVVERIRSFVEKGLASRHIQLLPSPPLNTSDADLSQQPTYQLVADISGSRYDYLAIDDRFAHKVGGGEIKFLNSLGLLRLSRSCDLVSDIDLLELRTRLRIAQFTLVPPDQEELLNLVLASGISDDKLLESAELRSFKHNLLRVRATNFIVLPDDANDFVNLLSAIRSCIPKIWKSETDSHVAGIKSDWLVSLVDIRDWAHLLPLKSSGQIGLSPGRQMFLPILVSSFELDQQDRKRQQKWLWDNHLKPMKQNSPALFQDFLESTKELFNLRADESLMEDSIPSPDNE